MVVLDMDMDEHNNVYSCMFMERFGILREGFDSEIATITKDEIYDFLTEFTESVLAAVEDYLEENNLLPKTETEKTGNDIKIIYGISEDATPVPFGGGGTSML